MRPHCNIYLFKIFKYYTEITVEAKCCIIYALFKIEMDMESTVLPWTQYLKFSVFKISLPV